MLVQITVFEWIALGVGLSIGLSSWIAGFYVMYRLRKPIEPDMAAVARFIERHRKPNDIAEPLSDGSRHGDANGS